MADKDEQYMHEISRLEGERDFWRKACAELTALRTREREAWDKLRRKQVVSLRQNVTCEAWLAWTDLYGSPVNAADPVDAVLEAAKQDAGKVRQARKRKSRTTAGSN